MNFMNQVSKDIQPPFPKEKSPIPCRTLLADLVITGRAQLMDTHSALHGLQQA